MLKELIEIRRLTHRGNVLDDADELIKDSLSSDVTLIDGITTANGLESVIWPILTGLPLKLRWGHRASCELEVGTRGLDDRLIKVVEITGSKISPPDGVVEGLVDFANEVDRLVLVIPTRSSVIVGDLFET